MSAEQGWTAFSRIVSLALKERLAVALAALGFVFFALGQVGAVQWLKEIIAHLSGTPTLLGELATPTFFALALPALMMVRGIGGFLSQFYPQAIAMKVVHTLRTRCFAHLMRLPKSYFDKHPKGEVLSKLTFIVEQVATAISSALIQVVRQAVVAISLFVYLLWLNLELTLVFMLLIPAVAIFIRAVTYRSRRSAQSIQMGMADVMETAQETLRGLSVVKAFGSEERESERFTSVSEETRKRNMTLNFITNITNPVLQAFLALVLGSTTWLAIMGLDWGVFTITPLTVDEFTAYFTAAAMLGAPLQALAGANVIIQRGIAAALEIYDFLEVDLERTGGEVLDASAVQGRLQFEDVTFRYPGNDSDTLQEVNFTLEPGASVALVGRSGSGKSTLVSLISGFFSPSQGRVLLDGLATTEHSLAAMRKHIDLVEQDVVLFRDTVEANLTYGNVDATMDEIWEACDTAGAREFIEELPLGLNTVVGAQGVQLSGGQRQRIAIARALLRKSKLLILDEATAALDSYAESIIRDAIFALRGKCSVMVIAHRFTSIEGVQRVMVLDRGKIVQDGDPSQLRHNKGPFRDLLRAQENTPATLKPPATHLREQRQQPPQRRSGDDITQGRWLYQRSWWFWLLKPASLLVDLIVGVRYLLYRKAASQKTAPPVVVMGNVTLGGTGKTPMVMWLARELIQRGVRPCIICSGYGGATLDVPQQVGGSSSVAGAGDEALLIYHALEDVPVIVCRDRSASWRLAATLPDVDVVLSDDGLQHYALQRQYEIALVDGQLGFGNGATLPLGPLREGLWRLKRVNALLVKGQHSVKEVEKLAYSRFDLTPLHFEYLPTGRKWNLDKAPLTSTVHAIAGIGNPGQFFDSLTELGYNVIPHAFPDHYRFSAGELVFDDDWSVVMTTKDAVKCRGFELDGVWALHAGVQFVAGSGGGTAEPGKLLVEDIVMELGLHSARLEQKET